MLLAEVIAKEFKAKNVKIKNRMLFLIIKLIFPIKFLIFYNILTLKTRIIEFPFFPRDETPATKKVLFFTEVSDEIRVS